MKYGILISWAVFAVCVHGLAGCGSAETDTTGEGRTGADRQAATGQIGPGPSSCAQVCLVVSRTPLGPTCCYSAETQIYYGHLINDDPGRMGSSEAGDVGWGEFVGHTS